MYNVQEYTILFSWLGCAEKEGDWVGILNMD
jgi:hypothetical protein